MQLLEVLTRLASEEGRHDCAEARVGVQPPTFHRREDPPSQTALPLDLGRRVAEAPTNRRESVPLGCQHARNCDVAHSERKAPLSLSDIRLQMSYDDEHADRVPSHAPYREDLERLRELIFERHPFTTGPLASYPSLEAVRAAARTAMSGRPYGNAHARAAARMFSQKAGEHLLATTLGEALFQRARQPAGIRPAIPSGALWPAPTGRTASAIHEHFTGWSSPSTKKAVERYRRALAEYRDAAGYLDPITFAGLAAQASSPPTAAHWQDCPSCGERHFRSSYPPDWTLPDACRACGAELDA